MANVFVSYAHADRARVEPLIAKLQESDLDVWWDKHLPVGKDWDEQLEQAMLKAPVILIVWSSAAKASNEVKDEAFFARKLGKALPACIERVELPFRLDRIQRIDLLTDPVYECPGWSDLVNAIRERRGMIFIDEHGKATQVTAASATGTRGALAMLVTPVLLIAGLAVVGLGQFVLGAQSLLPTMTGGVLCGGGLMYAVMAALGSRG